MRLRSGDVEYNEIHIKEDQPTLTGKVKQFPRLFAIKCIDPTITVKRVRRIYKQLFSYIPCFDRVRNSMKEVLEKHCATKEFDGWEVEGCIIGDQPKSEYEGSIKIPS